MVVLPLEVEGPFPPYHRIIASFVTIELEAYFEPSIEYLVVTQLVIGVFLQQHLHPCLACLLPFLAFLQQELDLFRLEHLLVYQVDSLLLKH